MQPLIEQSFSFTHVVVFICVRLLKWHGHCRSVLHICRNSATETMKISLQLGAKLCKAAAKNEIFMMSARQETQRKKRDTPDGKDQNRKIHRKSCGWQMRPKQAPSPPSYSRGGSLCKRAAVSGWRSILQAELVQREAISSQGPPFSLESLKTDSLICSPWCGRIFYPWQQENVAETSASLLPMAFQNKSAVHFLKQKQIKQTGTVVARGS